MDISGVDWSQDKYNSAVEEVSNLLKMAGFAAQIDSIPFVPCSALAGDNVFNKSENTPWYNGPTLFEAIDAVEMPPQPPDRPLRLPIQDVYKISGIGTVPVGKVETGILERGKTVVFNKYNPVPNTKMLTFYRKVTAAPAASAVPPGPASDRCRAQLKAAGGFDGDEREAGARA